MTRAYNTATTQQNSGGAVAGVTAGKNPVLNSNFSVWQRGTSAAMGSTGAVTSADRWATYSSPVGTMSRQLTGDTTNLPFIQYCARVQRNAGDTAANIMTIGQSFETINSIPFVGRTVTLSYYARKGANYSSASDALVAYVRTGTGTDQNVIATGYTGSSGFSGTATLTSTWQRFTVTGTIATNMTEIGIEYRYTTTGTAGAADYFEVTGVQLEVGSVATPYAPYSATYQGELAACQRYYYQITDGQTFQPIATALYRTNSEATIPFDFKQTMRVTPTLVAASGTSFYYLEVNGNANYLNSLTLKGATPSAGTIFNSTQASGSASTCTTFGQSLAGGSIAFSAEL
jgi:hypothetical protein